MGGTILASRKFSLESVLSLVDGVSGPAAKMQKNMLGWSKKMQRNFGGFGKNVMAADKAFNQFAKKAAIGAGVAAAGIVVVGKSFIDAAAEVEGYKTALVTMLGSQEAANQRFEEMSKFAASTPFELNEVVELGNQLQALGRYSLENMTILGDLAAASGKPIDQVTGAFAKLASGQKGVAVDMFRDLLITTQDWVEATGKGVGKNGQLLASTEEMLAVLPEILGKKGFSGMMDNMSKTNKGIQSNFADTITRFKQSVGGILLPAYNQLLKVLTSIVEKFSAAFSAKGQQYVDAIAAGIGRLAEWLATIDIAQVVDNFMRFLQTIKNIVAAIQPWIPLIIGLVLAFKALVLIMQIGNAVMWLMSLNPVTLTIMAIVAAVALLAVAIVNLSKYFGGFDKLLLAIGQTINAALLTPINAVIDVVRGLLMIMQKIPGVGKIADTAIDAVEGFQAGMNRMLTGNDQSAYARIGAYANPDTRVSESRSVSESRTTNEVFVRADRGSTVSTTPGGAPRRTLSYGAIQ